MPDDCSWIDIDCCHYCKYCWSLLALFELVRCQDAESLEATCQRKTASITERVGLRLQIPVYKISYRGEPLKMAAVQLVGKPEVTVMTPDQLAEFIDSIHDCEFCRKNRGGRFKAQGRSSARND